MEVWLKYYNILREIRYSEKGQWEFVEQLEGHNDWVRDVAWAPNIGLPHDTIASCSQDRTVIIWTKEQNAPQWSKSVLKFNSVVWRVSWSITGNILAVSTGDNQVTLWKEGLDGKWVKISSLNQSSENQSGSKK